MNWISVKERLPEDGHIVLVWYKTQQRRQRWTKGLIDRCVWIDLSDGRELDATHWCEITPPESTP